ncbi:hypothetical protein [Nocardioides sp. KR10-350]|uniref:hypothetical protein n=1 Tax=Nocardioides cheoyonin TaxID=3156615 RepID=UPI0032B47594
MNAGSQTVGTDTPIGIKCPEWCIDVDNADHRNLTDVRAVNPDLDPALVRSHGGPRFGQFIHVGAEEVLTKDEPLYFDASISILDGREFTAEGLRELAANALAAAEWLEEREAEIADQNPAFLLGRTAAARRAEAER